MVSFMMVPGTPAWGLGTDMCFCQKSPRGIWLIGYPIRLGVGDKNLPNVELKVRSAAEAELIPADQAAAKAAEIVRAELAKLNA